MKIIKITKKLQSALETAVIQTFADMAFIDAEPTDKTANNLQNIISINLIKPIIGKIVLYLPENCCHELTHNIFGKKKNNITIEEKEDCYLELLNILTGNFLRNYYGNETIFKTALPHVIFDENDIDWEEDQKTDFYFNAECSIFKISCIFYEK